jgi:hypothetical protein
VKSAKGVDEKNLSGIIIVEGSELKKRVIYIIFALFIIVLWAINAGASDLLPPLRGWDYYYHNYHIKGYPTFNKFFNRYDFYDLEGSYCGSLVFNAVAQDWEYKGL